MGVLKGAEVDILPRLPILMAFAAKFIGSNYGEFASDYRVLVEANLRCAEFFDLDQMSAISDPYRETQGFGAEIEYIKDGVPRCNTTLLGDSKDLSLLQKPDPYKSVRMLDRIKAIEVFKNSVYERYSIMGWIEGPASEAASLRGDTNFLMDLLLDPDFIKELTHVCVEVGVEFAAAQLESGADTIGIGDAIASQISPVVYEQLIFPKEKRLVDAIHEAGGYVRLHICGDITHLLPFISKLGADIVDLDWQVSMTEARSVLGTETILVGNLDPVNAVMKSKPEKIADNVRQIYQDVGDPYMVGAGCEIPLDTPFENLKALCRPIPINKGL
jgi:MtaA/CmuA family methyltransferase